jgi:hypothetical protein
MRSLPLLALLTTLLLVPTAGAALQSGVPRQGDSNSPEPSSVATQPDSAARACAKWIARASAKKTPPVR